MALKAKYQHKSEEVLRDVRPLYVRIAEALKKSDYSFSIFVMASAAVYMEPVFTQLADLILFFGICYFIWLWRSKTELPFKMPKTANKIDPNNVKPGGAIGKSEGILYIGNERDTNQEIWFNNTDARTHILYLGTTGSGKTEGLKAISGNAFCWASGFIYVDGKADTDLWSTLSNMARRFGRDDDMLIMNYMTGGTGGRVASNTLNPFSSGSASYLTNMLVSLMPDAEGDNAMWKERAVALVSSLMPCLVYKRDKMNVPLNVSVIRQYLGFGDIIRLSRDESVPEDMRTGLHAYLGELPGYVDDAFDDDGQEKPMPPDAPPVDTSVPRQQHGYLSMQFTRSLQSLGDDYGFIFDAQAADVDMMDVVLNRRMLITLIPALEKSSDETANLGKIIASTLKGMMGSTLGSTVEGSTETAIENKPTNSPTPFIAIFDEVGYYTAAGMAVMAAQARSLGFCLVYAAQDLPALEKRVREEARSITANCNIKLFGKLEDPTQTKEFFEKTVGQAMVTEVSGFGKSGGATSYADSQQASVQVRARAHYDDLRGFTEGRAVCAFGQNVAEIQVYYSDPGHIKAMRVQRFVPVLPPSEDVLKSMRIVDGVLKRMRNPNWDPEQITEVTDTQIDIDSLVNGFVMGKDVDMDFISCGLMAVSKLAEDHDLIDESMLEDQAEELPDGMEPLPESAHNLATDGPLSWMDVIGTSPEEAGMDEVKPDEEGEFSWGAIMGNMGIEENPDVAPSASAPVAQDPAVQSVSEPVQISTDDDNGMSWMDALGDGGNAEATPAAESVAETQTAPATQTEGGVPDFMQPTEQEAAPVATPDPSLPSVDEEVAETEALLEEVMGVKPTETATGSQETVGQEPVVVSEYQQQVPEATAQPETPPRKTREPGQLPDTDEELTKPMSWADVIGGFAHKQDDKEK